MVLNDLSAASIAARERGNSFYRAGNFNDGKWLDLLRLNMYSIYQLIGILRSYQCL